MPQEGHNSSSSSEAGKKVGLSPYMFETDRTPTEVENLFKELENKIVLKMIVLKEIQESET